MGDETLKNLKSLRWYFFALALVVVSWAFDPTQIYRVYQFLAPDESVPLQAKGFDEIGNLTYLVTVCIWTALFGRVVLEKFWQDLTVRFPLQVFGSFWAGYLSVVAVFRVFSFFIAPFAATLATLALGSLLLLRHFWLSRHMWLKRVRIFESARLCDLSVMLLLLTAIAVTYVSQVFWGDFRWVGHGPQQYQWFTVALLKSGQFPTIPIITQHCDEVLFTSFIMSPLDFVYEPIMATCLAMAFVKVSVAIFVFHFFRKVGGGAKIIAYAGSAFLMFGVFGLNPLKYLMYFDSGDPLFFAAHATRIVGVPVQMLILGSLVSSGREGKGFWSPLSLSLLGFGLALTSLSNTVFAVCLLVMGLIFPAVASSSKFRRETSTSLTLVGVALVFLGASFSYFPKFLWPNPIIRPGSMSGLTVMGGLLLFYLWVLRPFDWKSVAASSRKLFLRDAGIFVLASIVCLLFFGNIAAGNGLNREWMELLRSFTGISTQDIGNPFASWQGGRPEFGGLFMVDAREQGRWVQYSISSLHFAYQYLTFPLLVFAAFWRLRRRPVGLAKQEKLLFLVLLACFFIMFQLFFYIDFVNDMQRSWVKTRFLEGPIYIFFVAFFVFLAWETDPRVKKFFCWIALAWCVIPFFATERLDQWSINWWTLLKLLGH